MGPEEDDQFRDRAKCTVRRDRYLFQRLSSKKSPGEPIEGRTVCEVVAGVAKKHFVRFCLILLHSDLRSERRAFRLWNSISLSVGLVTLYTYVVDEEA